MTQANIARAIGLSARQYQRFESGVCWPSWDALVSMSGALGVQPHELFMEVEA